VLTCTSKIKIFVSSFKSLIKNKRKDHFDQMVVMVNYYHGRGHLRELSKWAFTISAGCSNYKSGDNGNFDYTREIHQPLKTRGEKSCCTFREKTHILGSVESVSEHFYYLYCVIPTSREKFIVLTRSVLYTEYTAHMTIHYQV